MIIIHVMLFMGFMLRSGQKNVAVITSDGGGDGIYNSVNLFKNGKFFPKKRSNNNWIGKIYNSVTQILGLNPFRHAYKVMGLAHITQTEKNILNLLNFFKFFKSKIN